MNVRGIIYVCGNQWKVYLSQVMSVKPVVRMCNNNKNDNGDSTSGTRRGYATHCLVNSEIVLGFLTCSLIQR